jgi:hypothetical protein
MVGELCVFSLVKVLRINVERCLVTPRRFRKVREPRHGREVYPQYNLIVVSEASEGYAGVHIDEANPAMKQCLARHQCSPVHARLV